ncbi:unnamed protein product, partial [Acanthocheilonema viteae]
MKALHRYDSKYEVFRASLYGNVLQLFSGRRFTGHNGVSTLENDSSYFKLLEADGDSLLVGA